MKQTFFLFYLACFCSFMLNSCRPAAKEVHEVTMGGVTIQNGDLLFVGIPVDYQLTDTASMDNAITSATGQDGEVNYIHVAILEVDENDSLWVIDATIKHGVDRYPFSEFTSDFTLKDGSLPVLEVKRLKDNEKADSYVEKAKSYLGRGYDVYFSPDNEEQYCSELVRNAYTTSTGTYIFSEAPMNFKASDGTMPPYWEQLFGLLGVPVPQGVLGTNPKDMSQESCLKLVGQIH